MGKGLFMGNLGNSQNYSVINEILMKEKHKYFHPFLSSDEETQSDINDHVFFNILAELKGKFKALFLLTGAENFEKLIYEYFKYNPAHSAKMDDYGASLPQFMEGMDEIDRFPYLVWIAQIDWFWSQRNGKSSSLTLPKGSLSSWRNIYDNSSSLNLNFDTHNTEEIRVENNRGQWIIKSL